MSIMGGLDSMNAYTLTLLAVAVLGATVVRLLTPKMDPAEPPLLKSTIPVFGFAISLFKGQVQFLQDTAKRHPSLPAFTLNVLKSKIHVIHAPSLCQAVFKNKNLSFEPFITSYAELLLNVSPPGLKIVKNDPPNNEPSFMRDAHKVMHETLQPGPGLLEMNRRVLDSLSTYLGDFSSNYQEINIYKWLRNSYTVAGAYSLYGPKNIIAQDPSLIESLWDFDEGQVKLMTGIFPKVLAPKAFEARAALQDAFRRYYTAGHDKDATALVTGRNESARRWGMSTHDIAQIEPTILFVTTTNAVPSAFWLLMHILSDPQLLADIREELHDCLAKTTGASGQDEITVDLAAFNRHTPLLCSAYHEALRLCSGQLSSRAVMSDAVIQPANPAEPTIHVKAGSVVQMPSGALHTNPAIWGADVATFDARRFMRRDNMDTSSKDGRENKKLQTQGFFPFGGGKHLCPGRFFAFAEILGFVSTLIMGFDFVGIDEAGRHVPISVPGQIDQKFGVVVRKPSTEPLVGIRRRKDMENVIWKFKVGEGAEDGPKEQYE